jgi:hypothetical protein
MEMRLALGVPVAVFQRNVKPFTAIRISFVYITEITD